MINKITLQIGDRNYTDFKAFNLYKDIESLSGRFSVNVIPPYSMNEFVVNIRDPNSPVIIDIDGEPIVTGYIDNINISYSTTSHEITLIGRDKTADFIDSTLEAKTFNPPIGFIQLLTRLLQIVGYEVLPTPKNIAFGLPLTNGKQQICIINQVGDIEPFSTSEGIQLRHSESAYGLIRKMAEKRQLILSSDGYGNIIIRRIGDSRSLTVLQNLKQEGQTPNNIKNGEVKIDFTERFNQYTIKSMLNPSNNGAPFGDDSSDVSNVGVPQSGVAFDPEVRPTRKFTNIGSSAMTSKDCKNRAIWQANIAQTKGFYYCCEVFGFRQNLNEIGSRGYGANPLWKPNQLVYVKDEFSQIDNDMLIKSVTYNQDLSNGSSTKLEMVNKNSYSLSIFEPALRRKMDKEVVKQVFGE